ncbi:hypothetical protein BC332_10938 [Capsicum chinense]|nr:hypothetical protein BC332_10938 [Capsicum chinense]
MTSDSYGISGQNDCNVGPCDENHDDRHRHNVSMQIGKEFSEEFLRKSLTPRKVNIKRDTEQNQPVKIAICNREYNVSGQQPSRFSDEKNRDIVAPFTTGRYVQASESPHSHQIHNPEAGGKLRLLCSYGGRILPRPNDGKLRYVGGEIRIISIRKNLTFDECVRKATAICNQPRTIKYQLPEEDLDALVSISSDEDLNHMIKEHHDLGKSYQRIRLFLVPSVDSEGPCSFEGMTL